MSTTKYKTYPSQVRAAILRVATNAGDWKTVAELHTVNERTAWGWIKRSMETGDRSGDQHQRGGSSKKLLVVHVDYLLSEIETTPELTLVQMVQLVEQKFDVAVNRETVRRALDARSFTLKKLYRDVVNRNSSINKQKRYESPFRKDHGLPTSAPYSKGVASCYGLAAVLKPLTLSAKK
ncbi:hypothetical protein PRIC1_014243 [Phytophthora ramorum]